jgi:hypothetical protein
MSIQLKIVFDTLSNGFGIFNEEKRKSHKNKGKKIKL